MINIQENIIEKLKGFCNLGSFGPGALLYNPNVNGKQEQVRFLTEVLQKIVPKTILETGTESGLFCYFIKCVLPDAKIITFGLNGTDDNRGSNCTNFLNEEFGNYITYIEGDSKETLTNFNINQAIEFAWIDGGHDIPTLMSDLENCSRLKIPNICVDDYYMIHDIIQPCVKEFLVKYSQYQLVNVSSADLDDRGIVYLKLTDES